MASPCCATSRPDAGWGKGPGDPSRFLGQGHPAPTQSRRRPTGQPRLVAHRLDPDGMPRSDPWRDFEGRDHQKRVATKASASDVKRRRSQVAQFHTHLLFPPGAKADLEGTFGSGSTPPGPARPRGNRQNRSEYGSLAGEVNHLKPEPFQMS